MNWDYLAGFEHSTWVTLISQVLLLVVPVKAKSRVAESPALAPMSMYTSGVTKVMLQQT